MKFIINALFAIILSLGWVNIAFSTEYQLYSCETYKAMKSCNKDCKKQSIIDIKVNSQQQLVLITNKKNSYALDNCKVIDEKNWSCNSEFSKDLTIIGDLVIGGSLITKKQNMFNENLTMEYSSITDEIENNKHMGIRQFDSFVCGKKKGWFGF